MKLQEEMPPMFSCWEKVPDSLPELKGAGDFGYCVWLADVCKHDAFVMDNETDDLVYRKRQGVNN